MKILIEVIILMILLSGSWFIYNMRNISNPPSTFDYLSCDSDNDCATTKFSINSCCIECDIFPINRQGLKSQEEWRKENCASKDYALCATFKCLWPDKNVSCIQNKCVLSEENNAGFKNGQFSLSCFNECSPQDESLILSTAQKTLEVLQKEFPWMAEAALKTHYNIEVDLPDISAGTAGRGRSYVNYENRTIRLSRIYIPTIAHETSHLLVAEYFGIEKNLLLSDIYPKGPSWFQEGLAMYLEYKVDDSRRTNDISLLKNTSSFLSLSEFESGSGSSLKLWYAQSWSILDYLIQKGGKERFKILCECVKQKLPPVIGEPPWSECFDNVYKGTALNWESFYEEWIKYTKEI